MDLQPAHEYRDDKIDLFELFATLWREKVSWAWGAKIVPDDKALMFSGYWLKESLGVSKANLIR